MFRHEPRIPFVPALREQVARLVASINQPLVSVPGRPAQAAVGNLCLLRNGNGSHSVFVGFHLPATGENVIYVHDPAQLAASAVEAAVDEGLQLLESMGFMLDDLRFDALAPGAQEERVRGTPLFSSPRQAPASATPAAAGPAAAIARLLSSF